MLSDTTWKHRSESRNMTVAPCVCSALTLEHELIRTMELMFHRPLNANVQPTFSVLSTVASTSKNSSWFVCPSVCPPIHLSSAPTSPEQHKTALTFGRIGPSPKEPGDPPRPFLQCTIQVEVSPFDKKHKTCNAQNKMKTCWRVSRRIKSLLKSEERLDV